MDSPFEMRLKMIEMAKNYLDRQYEIAVASYMTMLRETTDAGTKLTRGMFDTLKPKIYGIDEVTKIAEQFNAFVSKK